MFNRFFLVLCLVLFTCINAFGWEFKMEALYNWEFNYIKRLGPGDLFGDADKAQRISDSQSAITSIGLAGPNNGQVVVEGLSSKGSDASWVWEKLWLFPTFQINRAVKIQSVLGFQANLNGPYIGGPNWVAPPHRAGWFLSDSRSETALDGLTSIIVRQLWATAETPIGIIEVGRRTYNVGLGWSGIVGGKDTAFGSFGITAPYGPLSIQTVVVPSDTGEATDAYDTRNANLTPLTVASGTDRREIRAWNWLFSAVYGNGPMVVGYANRMIKYNHIHSLVSSGMTLRDDQTGSFARQFLLSNSTTTGTTANTNLPVYADVYLMTNIVWFKYFNGRFFLNGEWDFQMLSVQREGGRPISGNPLAWMMEGGAIYGPIKVSLAYFSRSGHDRARGVFDVSQSGSTTATGVQVSDSWNQYMVLGGAYSPVEPYSWLLGFYGGFNNGYDATGNPNWIDFKGAGARVDYAIASNLNLFCSYLYARRHSNVSTWIGQYTGGAAPVPTSGQNVADVNLAQEMRLGLDWKLLENFTFKTEFDWLKPGEWVKGAYRDYSSGTSLTNVVDGTNVQVNPDRSIDPIFRAGFGIEIKF